MILFCHTHLSLWIQMSTAVNMQCAARMPKSHVFVARSTQSNGSKFKSLPFQSATTGLTLLNTILIKIQHTPMLHQGCVPANASVLQTKLVVSTGSHGISRDTLLQNYFWSTVAIKIHYFIHHKWQQVHKININFRTSFQAPWMWI